MPPMCRSGTGSSRKHGRPPRSHQGAPDSALGARPHSTRDGRGPRRVLPTEERVLPVTGRAREQSDQCGGASTTPPAVAADTTRRLRRGKELARPPVGPRSDPQERCYPLAERCAQQEDRRSPASDTARVIRYLDRVQRQPERVDGRPPLWTRQDLISHLPTQEIWSAGHGQRAVGHHDRGLATVGSARRHAAVVRDFEACA